MIEHDASDLLLESVDEEDDESLEDLDGEELESGDGEVGKGLTEEDIE